MNKEEIIKENVSRYFMKGWGEGYFDVNDKGHLCIHPEPEKGVEGPRIDMIELIEDIKDEGIQFPVVVRFQDILRDKVEELNETFAKVIEQYEYNSSYMGVYPIKVNQMREVVEEVLEAGKKFNFGLEAGSKGELLSVLAFNTNPEALTILNGYKDKDFLKLAMIGRKMGRKIIIVVEKFSELEDTISLAKDMKVAPIIGLRARLSIGGSGKWAGSSGDNAKFGLTTAEIINSVQYCKDKGMEDAIKLIHFHIGSQVTNIQSIKNAITEATRFYTEVVKLGVPLEYLDVGGGLGVDYDGSSSTAFSSKNYNLESYVNDVVYTVKQICDLEEVSHPVLVSESGRFVTAHHSCIVTNVIGEVGNSNGSTFDEELVSPHVLVHNMKDILNDLDNYNLQEAYNDALFTRREVESAFRLGVLSIKEMARIDTYFWEICHEIQRRLEKLEAAQIDIQKLAHSNSAQYICNFSVFQSLPDCWAIDQLLPIVPLDRLDEEPTWNCTLVDITCDSDGKIDGFIKQGQKASTLKLHRLEKNRDYYLGFFLTGAYQDVMGDMHNLFGRLNEVHVYKDDDDPDGFYIEEVVNGAKTSDVLKIMQYNPEELSRMVKREIDKLVQQKKIQSREGVRLVDFFENCLDSYTYLKTE